MWTKPILEIAFILILVVNGPEDKKKPQYDKLILGDWQVSRSFVLENDQEKRHKQPMIKSFQFRSDGHFTIMVKNKKIVGKYKLFDHLLGLTYQKQKDIGMIYVVRSEKEVDNIKKEWLKKNNQRIWVGILKKQ